MLFLQYKTITNWTRANVKLLRKIRIKYLLYANMKQFSARYFILVDRSDINHYLMTILQI